MISSRFYKSTNSLCGRTPLSLLVFLTTCAEQKNNCYVLGSESNFDFEEEAQIFDGEADETSEEWENNKAEENLFAPEIKITFRRKFWKPMWKPELEFSARARKFSKVWTKQKGKEMKIKKKRRQKKKKRQEGRKTVMKTPPTKIVVASASVVGENKPRKSQKRRWETSDNSPGCKFRKDEKSHDINDAKRAIENKKVTFCSFFSVNFLFPKRN